jgi:hypothetical protein
MKKKKKFFLKIIVERVIDKRSLFSRMRKSERGSEVRCPRSISAG